MDFSKKKAFAAAVGPLVTAAATAAVVAVAALGATPANAAEAPSKANSHPTCEAAQAWFTKTYGSKAAYGELDVKTTSGKSCKLTFGTYTAAVIPAQTPSLDLSSCAKAQETFAQVPTGGKASITTTINGKPCTLSK